MLELHNIVKTYGEKRALDNFSLQLENGLYGLLGENGAGKSTLIKILTCNLKQDEGSILMDGRGVREMGLTLAQREYIDCFIKCLPDCFDGMYSIDFLPLPDGRLIFDEIGRAHV